MQVILAATSPAGMAGKLTFDILFILAIVWVIALLYKLLKKVFRKKE